MTSKEFIIWLRGFIAASHEYNLTPKGWETLKEQLGKVDDSAVDFIPSTPINIPEYPLSPTYIGDPPDWWKYSPTVSTTLNQNKQEQ